MHNKRRNNMNGGNGGGGQHRHHNRPRRFGGGGGRPQHDSGSNDPANVTRTRRNATQNREKYQMMARDALSSGDRVLAEYYLQHADHYHRVILALPPEEAPRPQYLRGHNPQGEGDQQGGQHPQEGGPSGQHQQGNHHPDDSGPMMPGAGHALPSFITQPTNPEGSGE